MAQRGIEASWRRLAQARQGECDFAAFIQCAGQLPGTFRHQNSSEPDECGTRLTCAAPQPESIAQ